MYRIICLIFLTSSYVLFSQSDEKILLASPEQLSFKELKENIKKYKKEDSLQSFFLKTLVKKAKNYNDTTNLIYGYKYWLYRKHKINYADSIILVLKHTKSPKKLDELSNTYYYKGVHFYHLTDYNASLNNYLLANEIKPGIDIDFNIGLIKNRIGDFEEALKIFKESEKFHLNKPFENDYLITLYALGDSYRHLKKLDSSSYYNNLGYKLSVDNKINSLKSYFVLNEGANNYDKGKYKISLDSLINISDFFIKNKDRVNLMMNYYFIAMSAHKLEQKILSIRYLKKMDSLYLVINHIEPEFRKGYELLIDESKRINDLKGELTYINRLLKIDSTLKLDYKNLTKNIYKNYDTAQLLIEKEQIINGVNKENNISKNLLYISIIIFTLLMVYLIVKNRKNKKKYNKLLSRTTDKTTSKISLDTTDDLNINSEIIKDILQKLQNFETENAFIKSNLTISKLAKDFKTNTKYLSQIINHNKQKNFSNYLNDLRIDYILEKLKGDKKFRNYTIKAIGNEAGFNSAESFSKAFYKCTNLKPSYYLKKLKKDP